MYLLGLHTVFDLQKWHHTIKMILHFVFILAKHISNIFVYIHSKLIVCSGYLVFYNIDVCSVHMQIGLHHPVLKTAKSQVKRLAIYFLFTLHVHLKLDVPLNHVIFT